jgi:hypothetical protein
VFFAFIYSVTASSNIQIFVKINTIGVLFVVLTLFFIAGTGFYALEVTDFIYVFNEKYIPPFRETSTTGYVTFFNTSFFGILGFLGAASILHNIALPICRNARYPENNKRDIFYGYLLVYLTNVICGTLGYIGFSGY